MRSTEYTESVKKLFISHRFDLNETPRFPLYGGIKWKTWGLVEIESSGKINNFLTDSAFSTLCPHKVENAESH